MGAVCLHQFNQRGGEGGCPLLADSTSGGGGGGGVLSVCFRLIQPAREGRRGCCCPLSADSTSEVGGAVCLRSAD